MQRIHTQRISATGLDWTAVSTSAAGRRLSGAIRRAALALALLLMIVGALAGVAAAPAAAAGHTYFVAPAGSNAEACSANSQASPFATIQKALGCTGNGDVVSLAPSGASPYPGIGTVSGEVTIQARADANARTVVIDAGQDELLVAPGAVVNVDGVSLSCITNQCAKPAGPTVTNEGTLTLSGDAVTGNASIQGGVVNTTPEKSSTPASLTLEGSTVSGNVGDNGGGVSSAPGALASGALTLRIANSTIAGNTAAEKGGGVFVGESTEGSSATIVSSTITGNSAGSQAGGVDVTTPLSISNTIIAANVVHTAASPDCLAGAGFLSDGPGGHNLIGDGAECTGVADGVNGDQVGTATNPIAPGLVTTTEGEATHPALANNGGPTDTVALQAASPAIGAGDPGTCEEAPVSDLDQRGAARHSAARGCDIGAYDSGGSGGIVQATFYVAANGSDAQACSANSKASPFATIQKALGCTSNGDVVSLAPSGPTPYPGIGTVSDNVMIEAQAGANARSVVVDTGKGALSVNPGASVSVAGVSLSCITDQCGSQDAATVTNEGTLTLLGDAVTGNAVKGGVLNTTPEKSSTPASLTLEGSTVSGNVGPAGAGISSLPGTLASGALTLRIANSTIAENIATSRAGGVLVANSTAGSSAVIVNSTITGNHASSQAGGVDVTTPLSISNTIIAANVVHTAASPDCLAGAGSLSDGPGGHNLIGNGTECNGVVNGADGDQSGTATNPINPELAALAHYGGATETEPALAGSPVIGAGSAASCQTEPIFDADQRGQSRNAPSRDVCDIGADDTGGGAQPTLSGLSRDAIAAGAKKVAVTLTGTGFVSGATLAASNPSIVFAKVTVKSATEITADVTATTGVPVGAYDVTVSQPDSAAICRGCLSVTAPTVSSISPSSLAQGARNALVTAHGSGFVGHAKVSFSGPGAGVKGKVTSLTATALSVKVSVAATAAPGTYSLTVKNGDGASATCVGCLTVTSG